MNKKSWKKFLNPKTLKHNLITTSLFITSFELFKEDVISYPKIFFSDRINQKEVVLSPEYDSEVMSKSKSPIYASLLWFLEMGAIDENDLNIFEKIKNYRNDIVHKMPKYICDASHTLNVDIFSELLKLLNKIGQWWVINFEIPLNPDYKKLDIDEKNIITGRGWNIRLMFDVALGYEPDDGYYYKTTSQENPTGES